MVQFEAVICHCYYIADQLLMCTFVTLQPFTASDVNCVL